MEVLTEEYLRSTSSLAQRIGEDIDTAREAYQDLWHTLKGNEQQQVLDEALIDPAAVLKYSRIQRTDPDGYIEPANHFSWFTKSQLNLFVNTSLRQPNTPVKKAKTFTVVHQKLATDSIACEGKTKSTSENNLLNKLKNKVTNLKIPSTVEEKQSLVDNKIQASVVKTSLSKPKTPPPPPPSRYNVNTERKALLSNGNESDPDDIPKTGFDFLDNW